MRQEFTVLGRVIGTATGWTKADTFVMTLYNFWPGAGINLPHAEFMNFDFENGVAETFDENGKTLTKDDLVAAITGAST